MSERHQRGCEVATAFLAGGGLGYTTVLDGNAPVALTASLDDLGNTHEEPHRLEFALDAIRTAGLVVSVGAVWWAARAAGLVSSLLAITPTWRHVDPLPVLGRDDDDSVGDWDDSVGEEAAKRRRRDGEETAKRRRRDGEETAKRRRRDGEETAKEDASANEMFRGETKAPPAA